MKAYTKSFYILAHPYGPINSYGELGDIHQIINAMKLRCDQLKSSENAVKVLKFSQVGFWIMIDISLQLIHIWFCRCFPQNYLT